MGEEMIEEINWDGSVKAVHPKSKLKEVMFPHKVSVVLPRAKNDTVIVCRRAIDKHPFPDTWCCAVGGKVAAGENIETAAIREMEEEVGMSVPVQLLALVKHDEEDYQAIFSVFTTEGEISPEQFTPDASEIQYFREFSLVELKQMIQEDPSAFAPTFRTVIAALPDQI